MGMIVEVELVFKIETEILLNWFGYKDKAPYRGKINRQIGWVTRPGEVEHFGLIMFHDKTCIEKDFRYDIVTTEKESRKQIIVLFLRNKKTVVNKQKDISGNLIF